MCVGGEFTGNLKVDFKVKNTYILLFFFCFYRSSLTYLFTVIINNRAIIKELCKSDFVSTWLDMLKCVGQFQVLLCCYLSDMSSLKGLVLLLPLPSTFTLQFLFSLLLWTLRCFVLEFSHEGRSENGGVGVERYWFFNVRVISCV